MLHVAVHRLASRGRLAQARGRRGSGPTRKVGLAIAGVALSAAIAPLSAALFGDIHGDAVAGAVLIGLLSAAVGFGLARVIGRQR